MHLAHNRLVAFEERLVLHDAVVAVQLAERLHLALAHVRVVALEELTTDTLERE